MQFRYDAAHTFDYSPVAGKVVPNNQQQWRFLPTEDEGAWPQASGVIYFGSSNGKIYAIDAITGKARWPQPFATGGWVLSSPVVVEVVVYVVSAHNDIYAIDAVTGLARWLKQFETEEMIVVSSPAVADGLVYVGSLDDNIYAIGHGAGEVAEAVCNGGEGSGIPGGN